MEPIAIGELAASSSSEGLSLIRASGERHQCWANYQPLSQSRGFLMDSLPCIYHISTIHPVLGRTYVAFVPFDTP